MIRKSFKGKLILPVAVILVLLILILTVSTIFKFQAYNDKLFTDRLDIIQTSLQALLKQDEHNTYVGATETAKKADVIAAVKAGDQQQILKLVTGDVSLYGVSYITVSDASGNVLVRSYDPANFGDSVAGQQNVADALQGKVNTYYESGTEIKVAIRTGAPVYDETGTLIGVISAGVQLDTNDFVDNLKTLYGVDATVFQNDIRVATTIVQNGQRAVGTKLSAAVAKVVLTDKQEYVGDASVLGQPYKAVYIPLLNSKGDAFAIVFMGISMQIVGQQTNDFIIYNVGLGLGMLVAAVLILFLIASGISKPLVTLKRAFGDLANGKLSGDIQVKSRDEIGQLSRDFLKVINILRKLLDDINEMVREREKGNTEFFIEPDDFNGDYKRLAENVCSLVSSSSDDMDNLLATLMEFNNGNFDADMPRLPGKKIVLNQRIDNMRDNLKHVSSEVNRLTSEAIEGNLAAKADTGRFSGDWREIMTGLNALLGAVNEPINEAVHTLREIAKGNLSVRVSGNYKGDYAVIKESLNLTAQTISTYIYEISSLLNQLADDNLDLEVTGDFIGDFASIKTSLNNIIEKLNRVMREITAASKEVGAGARQLSESSMTVAQGVTRQASTIEELNAVVVSVNEKMRANAENAAKANRLSDQSNANASAGNDDMQQMRKAMEDIKRESDNISKIIKTIDDIAFQTNLLALNAAVEAARAGESGRGFDVVAGSVRNLAGKSLEASKVTAEMIENTIRKVNEGTRIADETAEALNKIIDSITEVSHIVSEISDSSSEQSSALAQINGGIQQITEVVQSNSVTSEESASASEELAGQSALLENMIQVFKLRK